jgi:hypothetical protein
MKDSGMAVTFQVCLWAYAKKKARHQIIDKTQHR